jgi:dolichol-phosphate mannosyltransferase
MIGIPDPRLSIVIPVHDEAENVEMLVREIEAVAAELGEVEVLFVDDGSNDGTLERLKEMRQTLGPILRVVRHAARAGQSAAIHSGVRAARGTWVVTLDGDGQNDPRDILTLWRAGWRDGAPPVGLVAGVRRDKQYTLIRRLSSYIANRVRAGLLQDGSPDTGCGLKLFVRAEFLSLPRFNHMHRFLPALFARDGLPVIHVPVSHRPREHGRSNYGIGNRLGVGIIDLFGVAWLQRRAERGQSEEVFIEEDLEQ